MQYHPYQGIVQELKRVYREVHGKKIRRQHLQNEISTVLNRMLVMQTEADGRLSQDIIVLLYEMIHYLLSHNVVYVPIAFAEKMIQADLKFRLEGIRVPYSVFELSFEEGHQLIDGYPTCSALVTIGGGKEISSAMSRFINEAIGHDIPFETQKITNAFTVRFRAEDGAICHAVLPIHEFDGKTVHEVIEGMGTLRRGVVAPLNDRDKAIQKNLVRIVMGVLAYWNTVEPDIVAHKNRSRPSIGIQPFGFLVGSKIGQKDWFIRSGGPVVLAHKRYKRDEQGNIRVIWRRPAEVNEKAKPAIPKAKIHQLEEDNEL